MFASSRTIQWIENLAEQEGQISSGRRSSVDLSSTKQSLIEGETFSFLQQLHSGIDYLISVFNSRVPDAGSELRMQASSEVQGFTIARNGVRLTVVPQRPGCIQIACEKAAGQSRGGDGRSYLLFSSAVEAHFGSFNEVEWTSLGSVVNAEQVVRHYLTEFIQVSRVPS